MTYALLGLLALAPGAVLVWKLAYGRWPWTPRPKVKVEGVELELIEGLPAFLPTEFFAVSGEKGRAAMRAPFDCMRRLVDYVVIVAGEEEKKPLVAILHRTRLSCADCGCPISAAYQDRFWEAHAGKALPLGGGLAGAGDGQKLPTPDHRCPACGRGAGLFVYRP